MDRITHYIFNGGTELERQLAEADYCAMLAQREADDGDPIGMYQPLADEATVPNFLRRRDPATGKYPDGTF